ncbi:hypothetical protein BDP67DRAFT_272191 [Colletotrichum lupini]|nr:hypothetical protein BDP67DRAFT_272191 [Colletotrichum lupini]
MSSSRAWSCLWCCSQSRVASRLLVGTVEARHCREFLSQEFLAWTSGSVGSISGVGHEGECESQRSDRGRYGRVFVGSQDSVPCRR